MYGLPRDFDPDIFRGRRLEAVTYAENVIVLVFSDHCTVSISGRVRYQTAADAPLVTEQPPVAHTCLVVAVGQTVEATNMRSPQELILHFERGATVTLLDESSSFESYLIEVDGRTIVV
jgi:hypothetical protein